MALRAHLQPRDPDLAARVLSTLAVVAGGVTVLFATLQPGVQGASLESVLMTAVAAAGVVLVALLLRRMRHRGEWVWAIFPFLAVGVIVALDLFTRDATVSAQIFFLFPALYAGFALRRWGAGAVAVAAIVGDLVDVFTLLPPRAALVQSGYLIAAIAATTALLVLSGERQDALVTELRRQAAVDPLTGLVTRRVLDEAASSALSAGASEQGTGLILIDLDNFKQVNDDYGHPAGDDVLIQTSALLMRSTRERDTVSRMGGDEIAVLLAGCSTESVKHRAAEILRDIHNHDYTLDDGTVIRVTASLGLAHLPTHGADLRALYTAADASLYEAKRRGRNCVGIMPTPVALIRSA